LIARGATDITVVTPFTRGAVAQTLFSTEGPLHPRPGVTLRVLYPERPLSIGRYDFDPGRLEEAILMPHRQIVIPPPIANGARVAHTNRVGPSPVRIATLTLSDTRTLDDDEGGRLLGTLLRAAGFEVVSHAIVREDEAAIRAAVIAAMDAEIGALVLTGGT